MSNRQLEDMYEEKRNRYIANELGITYEELSMTDFDIHEITTNDDMIIGHYLQFSDDSPEEILQKIKGLEDNRINIHFEEEPDEDHEEEDEFDPNINFDPEADRIAEEQMYRIAEEERKKRMDNK